jgi:arylsulfatase A-like enzyme
MRFSRLFVAAVLAGLCALPAQATPHNILIFVADGLRYVSVTPRSAPTLWRVKSQGVDFTDSHALYPTITTVNASAIATGHYIGDTGNFGNALYSGFPSPEAGGAPIAIMESDSVLGEMNAHFGGDYLNETSLLAAARAAGFATAAIGKVGPTAMQDVTQRDGNGTIVIDDALGTPAGIALSPDVAAAITAAELPATAPKTNVPNVEQQTYMIAVATKAVLPRLAASGHPFAMLFWSRDPDATQHSQKDSVGKLIPGINGPTARAGIKNADNSLAALLAALKAQGLDKTTDVFVTADHGFSTIDRHSKTSASAKIAYADVLGGETPPGLVAIDLASALDLPLNDPHLHKPVDYKSGQHPTGGNGFLGNDPDHPDAMVISNGGSDHIYLSGDNAKDLASKIVGILAKEDYVGAIFVNDALGDIPGTLPMSAVNLHGAALTLQPSLIIGFRSFVIPGCAPELMCAAEMADTSLETGQGMHGTFSRADTRNFMAAMGPDFKAGFADEAPVSNADIAPTLAHILGLTIAPKGGLGGRAATEALKGGKRVTVTRGWIASTAATADGEKEFLEYQQVGPTRYFDAAGFPARTVGLSAH